MDSKKCSEFRLVSKKKLNFPSPSGRALNGSSDRIGKKVYRAICRPGTLYSATSFHEPLDSGLPNSYLSWSKEKTVDTLYPPEYLLAANMDKKYPL